MTAPTPGRTPLPLDEAIRRLDELDDANEGRQSDGVGAAGFLGAELRKRLDPFHRDWTIVREALATRELSLAKAWEALANIIASRDELLVGGQSSFFNPRASVLWDGVEREVLHEAKSILAEQPEDAALAAHDARVRREERERCRVACVELIECGGTAEECEAVLRSLPDAPPTAAGEERA